MPSHTQLLTLTHDCLNRLLNSKEKYGSSLASTAYDITDEYDPFGNRYQKSSANSGNSAITQKWVESGDYNIANNRFISTGSTPVSYDAAGNVTSDAKFRNMLFGYDANGRMNYSAALNGSAPVTTIYNGAGQKVATKNDGYLSVSVYDAGGKLAAEYSQYAAPTTADVDFITPNYQGSTSVITDKAGTVKSRHDYLPVGEEIGDGVGSRTSGKMFTGNDSVRQKYAAMEKDDATGLNHTLWRKDDNWSGRWTSPDPYGGSVSIADPQSFNRYAYVGNDPITQTDPLGLMAWNERINPYWMLENEGRTMCGVGLRSGQDPPVSTKDGTHPAVITGGTDTSRTVLPDGRTLEETVRILGAKEESEIKSTSPNISGIPGTEPVPEPGDGGIDPGSDPVLSYQMNPTQTAAGALKQASDAVRQIAYDVAPDSVSAGYNFPFIGGFGLEFSKDRQLYVNSNIGNVNDSLVNLATGKDLSFFKRNWKSGFYGNLNFIASTNVTPQERDRIIQGVNHSVSYGAATVQLQDDLSFPVTVSFGIPTSAGYRTSHTQKWPPW